MFNRYGYFYNMRFLPLLVIFLSVKTNAQTTDTMASAGVIWVETVTGDFSFKDRWSYNENVFKDEKGQLFCDGFCSERLDALRDKNGRINPDSVSVYYRLLDTTHFYHSLQCESSCSEFAGADFIDVIQIDKDSFFCQTHTTAGTHCSLNMSFIRSFFKSGVRLNSIISGGSDSYEYVNGNLRIEEPMLKKGILKAEFYLVFWNMADGDASEYIYWKGWIYSPIKNP
jgi:hypothetical protein